MDSESSANDENIIFDTSLVQSNIREHLSSTRNQQDVSIHIEVPDLQVISAIHPPEEIISPAQEARLSRIIDRPLNVTEPNLRLDLVPTDNRESPEQEPFAVHEEDDKIYNYTYIAKGSERGKDVIIEECEGIERCLLFKNRSKPGKENYNELFPYWYCKELKTKEKCTGKILFKSRLPGGRARTERTGHTCKGSPCERVNRIAVVKTRQKAITSVKQTCTSIADEVINDMYTPEDNLLDRQCIKKRQQLKQQASYARKKQQMIKPPRTYFWFDIRQHIKEPIYHDLFKVDMKNYTGGSRHLILANNEMINRLSEAKTWYFDATFHVVNKDHFKQVSWNLIYHMFLIFFNLRSFNLIYFI